MGKNLIIFFVSFAVALGGGYLFYQTGDQQSTAAGKSSPAASDSEQKEVVSAQPASASSGEGEIFVQRGCSACHAVSSLGVQGGATGPDLSKAYTNVPDKHGVPIEEFLKKPTSAVMSGVIGGNPLTDDEMKAILDALKIASEK
ncbi:c-type cytochrome [Ammoniphilus resinae]|uniref:Mono/diheme cytochrome c family protein n=1 Tax=Ammoniphilus resinae TaxID=861532 RepID=A0ABS4GQC7_9BACL|nr:c-type cytochrome [Ammoniphilus resinae]MBP1932451.1 mono/diheme cytochrome c family protein [Ammoniphilus resinae]